MQAQSLLLLPDRSAAHLDITGLADQDLMEALIENASSDLKRVFQHPSGQYLPVCRWKGVKCNARREVVEIHAGLFPVKGKKNAIELAYLPPHVRVCEFSPNGGLQGTVDTQALPAGLQTLSLAQNKFSGSFDMRRLPEQLEKLSIRQNGFIGSCDLTQLPERLTYLCARDVYFTGTIVLTSLPRCLRSLLLGTSDLRGTLNLKSLPPRLIFLDLDQSEFFGEICLDYLPSRIQRVDLHANRLCGSIHAAKIPESLELLDLSTNQFYGVAVMTVAKFKAQHIKYDTKHLRGVANEKGVLMQIFERKANFLVIHQDYSPMVAFVKQLDASSRRHFQKRSGDPLPFQYWKGIDFDVENRVVGIRLTKETGFANLEGAVNFQYTPIMVTFIDLSNSRYEGGLIGPVNTSFFPDTLREFRAPNNRLDDEFKFRQLPMRMETLDITGNDFQGTVGLEMLPIHMEILRAGNNNFQGSLNLTELPKKLRILELNDCQLTGTVNLNLLPSSLEELSLFVNELEGTIRVTRVPPNIRMIELEENRFEGTAVLSQDARRVTTIDDNPIEAAVDPKGEPYAEVFYRAVALDEE